MKVKLTIHIELIEMLDSTECGFSTESDTPEKIAAEYQAWIDGGFLTLEDFIFDNAKVTVTGEEIKSE